MKTTQKSPKKARKDYAGGGSDYPQEARNAASLQKGMIDDDMGKYGGVQTKKTPKSVDKSFEQVSGGGSAGSFHGKKQPSKTTDPKSHGLKS